MKDLAKFIKVTSIYLIGNVLTKVISFLMLPLYTKYLSPTDYGTYDLNVAYITFLSTILFFDLWDGILRFMFDAKKIEDKKKVVGTGIVICAISTSIYAISVFSLGNLLGIKFKLLLFFFGLFTNLQNIVGYTARGFSKNSIFAVGGVIGSAVQVIFNIVFIAYLRLGYQYMYVAACIGLVVNILLVGHAVKFISIMFDRKSFDKNLLKSMLNFSIPLSINSVAYWFLTSYNKVIIQHTLSIAANGMYAIANKFSMVLQLLTQCFQLAWQELTYSKASMSQDEMGKFYTMATNEYVKFMLLGLTIILPPIKLVFPYFINGNYSDSMYIIPFALLATVFSSISSFLGSIFGTLKKNKYIFTTTIMGSVVNIIVIQFLIVRFGIQGASISLALGFIVVIIRRVLLLNKYIKLKVSYSHIIWIVIYGLTCMFYFYTGVIGNILIEFLLIFIFLFTYRKKIRSFISGRK